MAASHGCDDGRVIASAVIRRNAGGTQWPKAGHPAPGPGVARAVDPDMNWSHGAVDSLGVDACPDADAGGIDPTVTETEGATREPMTAIGGASLRLNALFFPIVGLVAFVVALQMAILARWGVPGGRPWRARGAVGEAHVRAVGTGEPPFGHGHGSRRPCQQDPIKL